MELAYLPDSMTNYSACQLYQTWQEPTDSKYRPSLKETKISEKNCSICLEKKKRILSNYIKSKQRDRKNAPSIQEEEEKEE